MTDEDVRWPHYPGLKKTVERVARGAGIKVTPSCGCVFCDLLLMPNGSGLHATAEGMVKCTKVAS